ncbi:hypothetical protein [Rhodovibrio salinarum]|uniref:Uncharacterized protein n=1 Tax=Rhodovibrio salinarum TaxID=1087 RepID=A0A934QKB9_9PROT|nr:hypothetical protein [Rhodovibrio salinarum]MBK1698497.1 hypothetical protein [Rhodovibrio salinarum]
MTETDRHSTSAQEGVSLQEADTGLASRLEAKFDMLLAQLSSISSALESLTQSNNALAESIQQSARENSAAKGGDTHRPPAKNAGGLSALRRQRQQEEALIYGDEAHGSRATGRDEC